VKTTLLPTAVLPGVEALAFIHTVALARCCVAAKETGNRLNGFQMVRAHPEHRAEATV
jgi:hypothetical protein